MRICIDSSILIPSLQESDPAAMHLLILVGPELTLMIPRLVAQEVTRNLKTTEQVRRFYRLFQAYDFAFVVDEPVPRNLVVKYTNLGLPEKADAFIGAFAEWMNVRYLVSSNRHFLRELQTDIFDVLDAAETLAPYLPIHHHQDVLLHLTVAIFGALLNKSDFGRGELEQGVHAGVEGGFRQV
jgi:hypothetical protein